MLLHLLEEDGNLLSYDNYNLQMVGIDKKRNRLFILVKYSVVKELGIILFKRNLKNL